MISIKELESLLWFRVVVVVVVSNVMVGVAVVSLDTLTGDNCDQDKH
jgi:hypothetical protein